MARVVTPEQAERLGLPGRMSLEIVSGRQGARNASLRLVEIPVPRPGERLRGPHVHREFEECIYVLSGEGKTLTESGPHPLKAGDTILIPAGEPHVTRNTGTVPLLLLCFFPASDVTKGTEDLAITWD
ncbi:MAG TPA: cupin domain-containing protein [Xanthobacteraceae bacterium]|nr:cupin domain-containing protein [Xanthobacteraceae bacterium]